MNVKIRKGDKVEVISGREEDRGKRGEVIKVTPKDSRVVVQGINVRTKHQKQVQAQNRTVNPGRVKFEGSIDISNVMLVCPKCNKTTRVSISREGGTAHRVCKQCDSVIDE
jgi:large subunit ribosomal protein L24